MFGFFRRKQPQRPPDLVDLAAQVFDHKRMFPPRDLYTWGREQLGLTGAGAEVRFEPKPLLFADEPDCFYPEEGGRVYWGQDAAKKRIDYYILGMRGGERFKALFIGTAGVGKTALARIVAWRILARYAQLGVPRGQYYEVLPSQVAEKGLLDAFMSQLGDGDIVFVDEIHEMQHLESFFHVLHDTGAPEYPMQDGSRIAIPPTVSWIAATTNPGELDSTVGGAMRRRLEPEIVLEPPTTDVIASILQDQEMEIHPDAAYTAAERSNRLPWQGLLIYKESRNVARVLESEIIMPGHVDEAFEMIGLDALGLLPQDRTVIRVLLQSPYRLASGEVRYKMSAAALCSAAGVDRETYRKRVQPKLMQLGLLTTVGGQCLTPRALELYGGDTQQ